MAMTPAMESIFANAQQNAASLIETATLAINAKVNTVEEAEAMIQELSSEAVKYNELLTCIMNAMRQVESGDMQKEEAAGIIAPAVKELKDKCTALKIANVEAPGDDITEDEIATLRELIIGAKAAAEDRLVAIRLCDDCKVDPEVENELNPPEENGEAFEFDPATEGIASFIQKMHTKKVNKAKVTVLMDSLKDKKTDVIVKKVVDAMKPALVAGADGLSAIKRDVDEMQKADGGDPSKYEGKLSSFDCVVKTISGVGVGYIPDNPSEGTGLAWIAVPTKDRKGNVVGTVITVRTACEYILNPIKESEVTEAMEAYEEIAEEATILAAQYVNTTECKTAKALYQNAKKLYSMGSKDKALEYMKKAEALYKSCLKKLLTESGKFEKAERTDTIKKLNSSSAIRHNVTRTDSLSFAIARSKLENKIDRCTAHILQWTTKAGKETYQQTLDQLKADREQAKAAKKAAKATTESLNEMEDFSMDFTEAYESYIDSTMMEYVDYEAATEGANTDARKLRKNYAKEVRKLSKEAKKNYKAGNYTAAKNMYNQCADMAKQLAADVNSIKQTVGQVQIGNILHQLKVFGSCLMVGGLITSIKEDQNKIQNQINALNNAGGSMSNADLNKYTRDIINYANKMADKFKKLADKAAKGELASVTATESFDYSEFMFACESMMDELQMELDTAYAMESDGEESDSSDAAPSKISSKLRGLFSKLAKAVKHGDDAEADKIESEINDTVDQIDESADSEEKKKGMSTATKVGMAAAAAALIATGAVVAGKAMKKKAGGSSSSGSTALVPIPAGKMALKQAAKTVRAQKPIPTTAIVDGKKVGSRGIGKKVAAGAGAAAAITGAAVGGKKLYDRAKAKKAAKDATENAEEAYGIPAYDMYELIMEAFDSADDYDTSDEGFAAQLEAMFD